MIGQQSSLFAAEFRSPSCRRVLQRSRFRCGSPLHSVLVQSVAREDAEFNCMQLELW